MKKILLPATLAFLCASTQAQAQAPVTVPLFTPPSHPLSSPPSVPPQMPAASSATLMNNGPLASPPSAPAYMAAPVHSTSSVATNIAVAPVSAPAAPPVPVAAPVVAHAITPLSNIDELTRMRFIDSVDSGDLGRLDAMVRTNPSLINPGFADDSGNTPLMHASMHNNIDTVKYLVSHGANINAVNARGDNAFSVSYNARNYDTSRYLLSQGSNDPSHLGALLKDMDTAAIASNTATSGGAASAAEADSGFWTPTTIAATAGGVAVLGGVVAAATIHGGGNSSSTVTAAAPPAGTVNPENLNPSSFVNSQSAGNQGFADMKTQYALALGYNGSIYNRNSDGTLAAYAPIGDVRVAVVDSGVDLTHPALSGNVLTGLSVTCDDTGCVSGGDDMSTDGHGTGVASIIAANLTNGQMYGIAPDAKIMAIGFADNTGTLTNGDVPGIKYALTNGAQVLNGSYGAPGIEASTASVSSVNGIANTSYAGTTLALQLESAVQKHALFVFAAGNESTSGNPVLNPELPGGLPYYFQGAVAPAGITQNNYNTINPLHYDFTNNVVVVVSVDSNNVISSFSNQCGVAMNWCLAAPGENIFVATKNNAYAIGSGTSFAAPNVTGAIAIMLGAFPQKTPEQALQILYNTATDLGAAGVDPVYGHGLLNLQKATSPTLGGWTLASLNSSYSFNTSGVGLSAPFGNAMSSSNLSLQFLDAYGKNYTIPLSAVANNLSQSKRDEDRLTAFNSSGFDNMVDMGGNTKLGYSASGTSDQTPYGQSANRYGKFSYQSEIPVGHNALALLSINYQTNLADSIQGVGQKQIFISDALKNPYLALNDETNSMVMHYATGQSKMTTAAYYGNYSDEYDYHFSDAKSTNGMYAEYAYYGKDNVSNIALSTGALVEQNGFLGSEMSGAFGVDKATTTYAGVSGKYELMDGVALVGNYNMGVTDVSAAPGSMFTNFSDIVTNSFAAGAEFSDVEKQGDQLSFVVSQPLRVTSGSAGLMMPVGITSSDVTLFNPGNLSLTPTNREFDFESSYNVKLDDKSDLSLGAIFMKDPENTAANGNDAMVFGKYNMKF